MWYIFSRGTQLARNRTSTKLKQREKKKLFKHDFLLISKMIGFNEMDQNDFECKKCNLSFSSETAFKMHNNVHGITFKCLTDSEIALRRDLLYEEVLKQQENDEKRAKISQVVHKPRRVYKPKSKRVGLTKIKMEECLRCDACSCIYIDPQDYYKHMRNFHQKFNTVIPRSRRTTSEQIIRSPECFLEIPTKAEIENSRNKRSESSSLNQNLDIRQCIKNRWSQVLQRHNLPDDPVKIKEEPEDDYCYLLENVEVRIKTEPMD